MPLRCFWMVIIGVAFGCAAPRFDGRVYDGPDMTFRVGEIPPSWRMLESDATLLAFRDDEGPATIAVNGRCGKDSDDVPLSALVRHLFLQFTGSQRPEEEELMIDGRAALRANVTRALDGVPKQFVVYVMKKDGCVYDFMWIADPESPKGPAEFDRFVQGFRTLHRS